MKPARYTVDEADPGRRRRDLGGAGPGGARYEPIIPQRGRWYSSVLELVLEGGQLRFFHGSAPLFAPQELVGIRAAGIDPDTDE